MIDIHLYCQRYENYNGLAIIQNFTAHWVIQNEQMANVWNFNVESKSSQLKLRILFDSGMESNFQMFTICLIFIIQWARKS